MTVVSSELLGASHCSFTVRSAHVFGTTDRIRLEGRWQPHSAVPAPRYAEDTSGQKSGRVLRGLLLRCAGQQQHLQHL